MAIKDKATLKGYFEAGDKPTQAQFEDLVDTLVALLPNSNVEITGDNRNKITFYYTNEADLPDANAYPGMIAVTDVEQQLWFSRDGEWEAVLDESYHSNDLHSNYTILEAIEDAFTNADRTKLDGIEANSKDDQIAAEVPFTPAGGVTSTNVQDAIAEAATSGGDHAGETNNPHSVTKAQVGLGSADDTSDVDKPVSTAQQTALDLKAPLASPTFTGTVGGVSKDMVGLGNADNTSDVDKPISTSQQNALDLKAPLASPTFTGTVNGINKTMVGLGNVDNTSDADKPVSTAQQTALDLKAPLASPAFTGTVTGVTKSMVGLGNVDNTADADKPVSNDTQTALDLKAPLASPTFTGTVNGVTKAMVGLGNVDNTSDTDKPVSTAQQAAIDSAVVGLYNNKGGYNATTNTPELDPTPSGSNPTGIKNGDAYTVEAAGTFFAESVEVGDVLISNQDDPTLVSHWTRVNKNISFGTTAGTAAEGNDSRIPTQDENDALTGTNGTPSSSNKLVTNSDPRLSDTRDPNTHASEHTNGTDDIQSATNAQKGLATAAHITAIEANTLKVTYPSADSSKLAGIAAGAEVNPDVVSQAEAEAGTSTDERIWTAERVKQAIDVHADVQVDENYTTSGTDRNLTSPDDGFATISQIFPIRTNTSPGMFFKLGNYTWSISGQVVFTATSWSAQFVGGPYGIAYFKCDPSNPWHSVATTSLNGLQTITLPISGDSSGGGTVNYYFDSVAWENAFVGTTADVVITQNGSIYRSSISPQNLVVDSSGKLGPLGHNHDSEYINKTNTTEYIPSAPYHPVTKNYFEKHESILYNSGVNASLTNPLGSYDTESIYIPISSTNLNLKCGLNSWYVNGAAVAGNSYVLVGDVGTSSFYGSIRLNSTVTITAVDSSANNGVKTFNLPNAGGATSGGSVSYYFHAQLWANAFVGNISDVVIAQNGDVYKDSIAPGNLVVTIKGEGPLVFGTTAGTTTEGNDARLSDNRDPNAHAAEHTDGTDDIQSATNSQKGLATSTQITALESNSTHRGLTTGNPHSVTKGEVGLGNVDNTSDVNKPVSTAQQSAIDSAVVGLYENKGGYNATTNTPEIDPTPSGSSPSGIKNGDSYTVEVAGTFFTESVEVGDVLIASQDDPTLLTHWARVNKNISFGTTAGTAAEGNDSRLSDTRDPNAHASEHTNGTDDIQSATNAQKGLATAAHITAIEANTTKVTYPSADSSKLAGIDAGAEVNPDVVSQVEAEAGTATTERTWTAERVKQAIDALGGGGGVSFASGIIKSSSSVVNDSSLSNISNWSGVPGAFTSTITFNSAKAYQYAQQMSFSKLVGTYNEFLEPTSVKATSTTTVLVTMPNDNDLYIGSI